MTFPDVWDTQIRVGEAFGSQKWNEYLIFSMWSRISCVLYVWNSPFVFMGEAALAEELYVWSCTTVWNKWVPSCGQMEVTTGTSTCNHWNLHNRYSLWKRCHECTNHISDVFSILKTQTHIHYNTKQQKTNMHSTWIKQLRGRLEAHLYSSVSTCHPQMCRERTRWASLGREVTTEKTLSLVHAIHVLTPEEDLHLQKAKQVH